MEIKNQKPFILVVSPIPLYPLTGGGASRIWGYIDYLRKMGFWVEVVSVPHAGKVRSAVEARVDRLWEAIPETKDAILLSRHFGLWGMTPSWFRDFIEPYVGKLLLVVQRLEKRNKQSVSSLIRQRNPILEAYVKTIAWKQRPFAVLTTFVWTARVLSKLPSETIRIIDTQDIQHLRAVCAEEAGYNLDRTFCTRKEEVRELMRADLLLAIQKEEERLLSELCPDREILLVEHAYPITESPPASPENGREVLFVGNLYEPNVEGINAFIQTAWPVVLQEVPDARLIICGRVCRKVISGEGIVLEGVVEELNSYYARAALVINPVPYGTGLKIKTVEALGNAKALVTTPSGVTGLPLDERLYRVTNVQDMAPFVIEFLKDIEIRRLFEKNAHQFAQRRFSPEIVYATLYNRLQKHIKEKAPLPD